MSGKIIYNYLNYETATFVVDDSVALNIFDKHKIIHKVWKEVKKTTGKALNNLMNGVGCKISNIKIIVENHEYTLSLKTMFDPINNEMYYYISRQ